MTPKPRSLMASSLLALVSAACVGEASAERDRYTIVDSAGIQIVESFAPAWGDEGARIDPEPSLRIGREGEGPSQFGRLTGGVFLADGQIAVMDALAKEVRVFDSAGRHLRTFGGDGDGPGEFRRIAGLFRYPGDSLAAFDQGLYRTTIFSRSPGLLRSIPNQVEGNFVVFGLIGDGPFVLYNPGQYRPELPQGLQWDSTDIVAMDRSDGSSEVLIRLPVLERMIGPAGRRESLTPFGVSIHAVAENGFYWATSDRYEIFFYDGRGKVRRILRRPLRPRSVEAAMIEEYEEGYLTWVRGFEGEGAVPRYRRRFEEGSYAETVPLFGGAFVDKDQRRIRDCGSHIRCGQHFRHHRGSGVYFRRRACGWAI